MTASRREQWAQGAHRALGRLRQCAVVAVAVAVVQDVGPAPAHGGATSERRGWEPPLRLRGGGQGWYMDQVRQQQKRGRIAASRGEGKHGRLCVICIAAASFPVAALTARCADQCSTR